MIIAGWMDSLSLNLLLHVTYQSHVLSVEMGLYVYKRSLFLAVYEAVIYPIGEEFFKCSVASY